ncbi:MAG: TlpA disulfide reductase family protein [Bacteroidota bacterium]
MRRSLLLAVVIGLLSISNTKAQTVVLKKFINKFDSYKSISYTSVINNEMPWGDENGVVQVYQGKSPSGKLQFEEVTDREKTIFDGENLLVMYLQNKYYQLKNNYKLENDEVGGSKKLFRLSNMATKALNRPEKVKMLPDTIINKTGCYHIHVIVSDTLRHQKRVYNINDLYISKNSFLPVYFVNTRQVLIGQGDVESNDPVILVQRNKYLNYSFNKPEILNTAAVKIPAGYITSEEFNNKPSEKKLPLLTSGTKAPDWKLQDTKGKYLSNKNLKEKVVLIDFYGQGCAPCIMTEPIMARLHEKYKNTSVNIISVCIDKDKASAVTLSKKSKYPVYMKGKDMYNDFHGNAIPTFYLIDKQGIISKTYVGYDDELEQTLIAEIDKIK